MLMVFLVAFGVNAQNSREIQGAKPYHAPKKGVISNVVQAKGPLSQDFEGTFPPSGWALTAGSGDWAQFADVDHTSGSGNSAIYDCYSTNGVQPAYMTTPEMTVTAGDATFSFWCNYYLFNEAGTGTANLYVDKSTDGGATWTNGTTDYLSTIVKDTWTQFTIDLTANIGQNVKLRFKAISDYGYYNIAIDDVAGPNLTTYPFDAGVVSINGLQNIYRGTTTASVIPSATVQNFGTNAATFDVTFTAGTFTSTKNVVGLAAGATSDVTFDAWTPSVGVNNITVTAALTADAVASNNTYAKSVFNYIYSQTNGLKWDNGPIITNAGTGSGGKDVSVSANGTYGFNYKNSTNTIADEFVVPAGETWIIDQFVNYGYQTGSTTTSTFTNNYFKVWNGDPSTGTATLLFDYSAANQLTASVFSNIYRTQSTDMATATTRPIMENTCNLATKFNLTSGTYWIEWSATGSLTSGPWAVPISTTGMVLTDNARLYDVASTTWNPSSEELSFKIFAHNASTANDILTFDLTTPATTGIVDATAHTVALTVPFGTPVTALIPTFTLSTGATAKVGTVAQISGTTANDFTSTVTYDVTAEDGITTQAWTVMVTVAANTANDILTFDFATPAATGIVDATAHTVALTVPFGTNVTALVPTFTLSTGATAKVGTVAQVSGTTANDFTSAVTYDVTAEDGITTQAWTVTVSVAAATDNDILTFNFNTLTPNVTGTVDATAHTVALTVPFGTNVTALVPTFTLSAGATAKVGTVAQVSGTTANDFTSAVTYDVTAVDGTTTQAWTVTVTIAAGSTATDILTFDLTTPAVTGTVNATAHTVALNVPFGTAVTALVPTFTLSAGATAKVGTVAQVSGTTANDFTSAVVYDVTAEDGTTTQAWTVTVTVAAGSTATDIITFNLTTPATTGTVDPSTHTVVLNVPAGTNVTALVPTFTLSAGATAKVGTVAQVSGTTANDFTSAVVYDVTAEDGTTTQAWTVTVNVAVQTYTVTFSVIGANGTLAATVDAAAITSPATVEAGKNVIFTAAPANNFQVKEWKLNNVVVAGNVTNTYTLSTIAANSTVTVEFELIDGINEATENVVSIYPNPANNVVNVKMNTTISKIEVVSLNGQIVAESLLNNNEGSINISNIANGMYFLRIETANGITMNKIQISK